jgi:Kef-type K+ transport system membrane component KefB
MQWLLLVFTLIAMGFLQKVGGVRAAPLEARATLALGFLLLAAFVSGTIAERLRLPRLAGFLIAGLVVGPAWLGLVRPDEVVALSVIVTGALTLIAFAAGSQLRFGILRDRTTRIAILRIVAGAIVLPFVSITFVVLTVSPWFPLTAHQPFGDALTVALVLGAVATVSSPVVTWAMINDSPALADTPVTRTLFHVTVVQDFLAVLLAVLLLALAQPLASSGAVTPGIAWIALLRFLASVGAGILVGLALEQYVRQVGQHMVLLLVGAAFVFSQAVRLVELEPVSMALAAGCTVANAAPVQAERIRETLDRCALPVYIVFFALTGSTLQLDVLTDLGAWALLLIGLRASSLWGGMRWAARHPAVPRSLEPHGWLGLISQGGLAIALATILRRAFPEWGITLESLIVAIIGVHLLAGPICFHWMVGRLGGERGAHDPNIVEMRGAEGDAALVPGGGRV